jgi:hypothetical protein
MPRLEAEFTCTSSNKMTYFHFEARLTCRINTHPLPIYINVMEVADLDATTHLR